MNLTAGQLTKLRTLFDAGITSGKGPGEPGHMCVEQALHRVFDGGVDDTTLECQSEAVASYMRRLNDASWPTPKDRSEGMFDLTVASVGSRGIDDVQWLKRVAELFIREQLPETLRTVAEMFAGTPHHANLTEAAKKCENEGTADAARWAAAAADDAARWAAAADDDAADAARLKVLRRAADIAVRALDEACALLDGPQCIRIRAASAPGKAGK